MHICQNCINEINQVFSFTKRCELTDTILQNCVKKFKTDSAQSEKVESIITEQEMNVEIKSEINLPNIYGDFEYVEDVNQYEEVKIKCEESAEVKQEEELIIENEFNATYDVRADEKFEKEVDEDQDEMYSEKSDNSGCCSTDSNTEEEMAKEKDSKERNKSNHEKHPLNDNYFSSCPVCSKAIKYRLMRQHMKSHTEERSYCCEICGASFSESDNFIRHKRVQHSESSDQIYQCQTCEKSFKILELFKVHQEIHAGNQKSKFTK